MEFAVFVASLQRSMLQDDPYSHSILPDNNALGILRLGMGSRPTIGLSLALSHVPYHPALLAAAA